MTVDYNLTAADYADYCRFHYERSALTRRMVGRIRWGWPAVWLLFVLVDVVGRRGPGLVDYVFVAWAVIWVLVVPKWFHWGSARRVRQLAEQGIARGTIGPHTFSIEPDGVRDRTPFSDSLTCWDGLERVVESPGALLVYVGPNAACAIPRRAFPSDAERAAFRVAIERGIARASAAA